MAAPVAALVRRTMTSTMATTALTYEELATRTGMSLASARRLVHRRKWRKAKGNDGRAVVQVPDEFLEHHQGNDGRGDQGEAAGAGLLGLGRAVVQPPETVEAHGAAQRVAALALVQLRCRLPAELGPLQPVILNLNSDGLIWALFGA